MSDDANAILLREFWVVNKVDNKGYPEGKEDLLIFAVSFDVPLWVDQGAYDDAIDRTIGYLFIWLPDGT